MRTPAKLALAALSIGLLATACASKQPAPTLPERTATTAPGPTGTSDVPDEVADPVGGSVGGGVCAATARLRGHTYVGLTVSVVPRFGGRIVEAVFPPCDDHDPGDGPGAERVKVAALKGISLDEAFVWVENPTEVFVREDRDIPARIERLRQPPACHGQGSNIRLEGQWLGILGADGQTESDLVPPYDLELMTTTARPARFDDADLFVRVPKSLGRPLTQRDVRSSLWEGGSIRVEARCEDGRLVATSVEAFPG